MIADDVRVVDHHCHGLVDRDLSPEEFRSLGTESDWDGPPRFPGTDPLDSPFGLGIRSRCAPLLDLNPHSSIDEYVDRRRELGAAEVNLRLMTASNTALLLLDTGFTASPVVSPDEMTASTGIPSRTIIRLERLAEEIAPRTTAGGFARDFSEALADAAEYAAGFKSIMAYRAGFRMPDRPPSEGELSAAAATWLKAGDATGTYRLTNPVVLAQLLWEAVSHSKPIQLHVGFGDSDVHLHASDPTLLSGFFAATRASGASFMLLHCYPFVREAGSLAHIFPHVYLDVGLVSHYLGPSAMASVRESVEIAPFHKVLYSSDAYGLAEHYLVSATSWRRAISTIVQEWLDDDWLSPGDAERIVHQIAAGNAERVYDLRQP